MITLNLIGPEQRRRLRYCLAVDELRSLANTLIFIAVLVSVFMLAAKYLLNSTAQIFQSDVKPITATTELKAEDIAIVNFINATLTKTTAWSDFLERLSKTVPAGVNLKTINVNAGSGVQISGHAAKREQLLQFQNALNDSGLIKNLYSPVKNLLQAQNVDFELTAELPNRPETKKK